MAADHCEANGETERANYTVQRTFNLLPVIDCRFRLAEIIMEAKPEKNLIRGSKASSAFELMYVARPRVSGHIDHLMPLLRLSVQTMRGRLDT